MASPPMLGFVEVPKSLEANLVFSQHTTPICGKGTVSSRSGGHNMGNVLPSILAMDENTIQGTVIISSPLLMGGKSYADLLKPSHDFIQPFPMTAATLKMGGYVSLRVDSVAYQSRLEL